MYMTLYYSNGPQYLLLSPRIISDILSQVVSCHGNGHWVLRLTQYRNQQPQNLVTILVQFHHVLTLERNGEFTSLSGIHDNNCLPSAYT